MELRGDRSVPRERNLSHSHSSWRMQGTQLIQAESQASLAVRLWVRYFHKQEQDFRPKKGRNTEEGRTVRGLYFFQDFFGHAPFFF